MWPLALQFPDIDPVAIALGPVAIRWYGLAYMTGLLLGWLYIRRLLSEGHLWPGGKAPFGADRVDDLLIYVTAGVIAGGRLGYILFYEPAKYASDPLEVLRVWNGGMSFHGAIVGSALAVWLFARNWQVNVWSTMDVCAAANPIGLFFGRVANFINGELYGRPTDSPLGVVFCNSNIRRQFEGGECPPALLEPRHPSQLYEAALEGIALFIVLRYLSHTKLALQRPGLVIGTFLAGYGIARSVCELYRDPHAGHPLNIGPLTAGIFYSIPMVLLGLYYIGLALKRTPSA